MPYLKRIVVAAMLAIGGCSAESERPDTEAQSINRAMSDGYLGPVSIGMSGSDLESLGVPYETTEINWEGDYYPQYALNLEADIQLVATLNEDSVWDISTVSSAFVTPEGARIGDVLTDLAHIYPEGFYVIGDADGLYFHFATSETVRSVFVFDTAFIDD